MKVTVTPELIKEIVKRPKDERKAIGEAITQAQLSWGKAHVHDGISIRRLYDDIYECRVGLSDRLVFLFVAKPPELKFYFLGDHDEVKNHIKSKRR